MLWVDASVVAGRGSRVAPRVRVPAWVTPEAVVAAGLTVAFLIVTAWWLKHDSRVPDWDNAKHLLNSLLYYDRWHSDGLLGPFKEFTQYPPLVHCVGALGVYLAGVGIRGPIMTENLVFVPLLALGAYGTGVLATRRALGGLLAVVFALGTPMLVSQFHVMMLDAPLAATVAASVWLLLASRRFSNLGFSAAAGAVVGLGVLTKQTFPFFVAGLIAVMLIRGGWRNWRGLVVFAAVAFVLAGPWYLDHLTDLRSLAQGSANFSTPDAVVSHGKTAYNPDSTTPPRWTSQNATWYVWGGLNHQLLLPLALFVGFGAGAALVRWLRRREPDDFTPELLVGGLVAYLGMTFFVSLHDVRYTLPALVYMAVLGTGWIALARPPARIAGSAALGAVALLNFTGVAFGWGHTVGTDLPGGAIQSGLGRRHVTLYSPRGYLVGGPSRGGNILDLMLAAKADGKRYVGFYPGGQPFFNGTGLGVLARAANLPEAVEFDPANVFRRPGGFFILTQRLGPGLDRVCTRLAGGTPVYGLVPNRNGKFGQWEAYCPPRRPA